MGRVHDLAEVVLARAHRLLGELSLGDVGRDPADRVRLPRRVDERELDRQIRARAIADRDRLFELERELLAQHTQVVRTHELGELRREELAVAAPDGLVPAHVEERLELAVDEQVASLGVLQVDDRGRVVEDRLHALAGLAQLALGLPARGDVLHLDDQVERPVVRIADQRDGLDTFRTRPPLWRIRVSAS